ncbi:MAG: hypothetical protein M1823_004825 [Watsoniomyces obsoletus]|nr:MAG: hypothetical protein M1823_004825 [Watsoniomyces obsoletus]
MARQDSRIRTGPLLTAPSQGFPVLYSRRLLPPPGSPEELVRSQWSGRNIRAKQIASSTDAWAADDEADERSADAHLVLKHQAAQRNTELYCPLDRRRRATENRPGRDPLGLRLCARVSSTYSKQRKSADSARDNLATVGGNHGPDQPKAWHCLVAGNSAGQGPTKTRRGEAWRDSRRDPRQWQDDSASWKPPGPTGTAALASAPSTKPVQQAPTLSLPPARAPVFEPPPGKRERHPALSAGEDMDSARSAVRTGTCRSGHTGF